MTRKIVLLPGDGIGPEVTRAAHEVAIAAAEAFGLDLCFETHDFGGIAIDRHGDPFPEATRQACLAADAVFLGAVGGPRWDGAPKRPEAGLLDLRKSLGAFANLRPARLHEGMEDLSPLRPERVRGMDLLIVRELTGGLYFGDREEGREAASDLCAYSREEVERVARIAFEAARKRRGRVTSVDKANVLATGRLWRAAVTELHDRDYPDVALDHMLVDAMAMKLVESPAAFDVVLTENMFGDILSDEAASVAGSIGLAASASLSSSGVGIYEPIHGSAPDIAGRDVANPVGAILSMAMLFDFALERRDVARAIEAGVNEALDRGRGTADLGRSDGCEAMTRAVCEGLSQAESVAG